MKYDFDDCTNELNALTFAFKTGIAQMNDKIHANNLHF